MVWKIKIHRSRRTKVVSVKRNHATTYSSAVLLIVCVRPNHWCFSTHKPKFLHLLQQRLRYNEVSSKRNHREFLTVVETMQCHEYFCSCEFITTWLRNTRTAHTFSETSQNHKDESWSTSRCPLSVSTSLDSRRAWRQWRENVDEERRWKEHVLYMLSAWDANYFQRETRRVIRQTRTSFNAVDILTGEETRQFTDASRETYPMQRVYKNGHLWGDSDFVCFFVYGDFETTEGHRADPLVGNVDSHNIFCVWCVSKSEPNHDVWMSTED